MPTPPLSETEKRTTVEALRKAGGNVTYAASLMGIPRGTISVRKLRLLADPKWRDKVPHAGRSRPEEMVDPRVPRRDAVADARKEAERHRKRADMAEARLERERAARARVGSVKPAKARRGPDDFVRVIRPDLHGAYQDRAAVAAYLADVKKLRPRELVGLGDLADCTGFLAQHHVWGVVAETDYTFEDDVAAVNAFLDAEDEACGGCERDDLAGNHDARIEQWCVTQALRRKQDAAFLHSMFAPEVLFRMKQRGRRWLSRSASAEAGLPQGTLRKGKCLFVHGHHVGENAAQAALKAYKTSVCFGHTHRQSSVVQTTVDGTTIGAWTIGHLSRSMPYWQHGRPTGWAHGYAIQIVARSGAFLHITVPIIDGVSLLPTLKLG